MRILKILLILITVCTIASCTNQNENQDADTLAFYALRHVEGKSEWIRDSVPLFTEKDIESYIWDTHTIFFSSEFLETKSITNEDEDFLMNGSKILSLYYPDKFAVYLYDQELYWGYVEPQAFISFYPGGPVLSDNEAVNGVNIECLIDEEDTRSNQELKDFLILKKLLK